MATKGNLEMLCSRRLNCNYYLPDPRRGKTTWHSDLFYHFPMAASFAQKILQIKTKRQKEWQKQPAKTKVIIDAQHQRRDRPHSKSQHETHNLS